MGHESGLSSSRRLVHLSRVLRLESAAVRGHSLPPWLILVLVAENSGFTVLLR